MNSFEFLEKLGFSSNEAKVYGTLIKHKVLNGYEIAKLSGVARSLVYEVINRLIAKGAVIRIDGEPNFYKPIEYQDLIRSIKEENEKNIACAERELQQLATENADVDYVMNIVGEEKYVAKAKKLIEKENLLSKGCSGADFLQAIHNLAERYGITDEMTKNFLVYNFQKEKTQNGKKR